MLVNRRQALLSIGLAAFHGVAWSLPRPFRPALWEGTNPDFGPFESSIDDTIDDRLRADLARLAPRAYSEEGIPMFLACVNLVTASTSHQIPKITLNPLSAALSSTLRRNAEAYRRIKPGLKGKDIAPLVEVLADRDFTRGETTEVS